MDGRETKRKRGEPLNNIITGEDMDIWPRFIVLTSKDVEQPLSKLSPFIIEKAITGLAGSPKSVKKLRSGQLLIECDKRAHSNNLLRSQQMAGINIESKPHVFLNSSKGIIKSKDLEQCSEKELVEELKNQGVTEAYRIKIKKENKVINTNTIILTFNRPNIPKEIKAGFLQLKVEEYIPNPMRCFNCQRFGHLKKHCKRNAVCPRCGTEGHELTTCDKEMKCINCNGNHLSFSKVCPKYIEEKEIQKVKTQKNISYQEARKITLSQSSIYNVKNYAEVIKTGVKKSVKNAETQTPSLPELYYKDENGVYKKWEMKLENKISQNTSISTQATEETAPSTALNKKTDISLNTSIGLNSQRNKNKENTTNEKPCCSNKTTTDFKTSNHSKQLNPNKKTNVGKENNQNNEMEITDANSSEDDTHTKSENRKIKTSSSQAKTNIITTLY